MKFIGVPTCPYCGKRINLIRVWSVKKHGEFMCPRCKGMSNIFLSPLVYLTAVIAISAGFLIYFFQKFIADSVGLMTIAQVFTPFALFFLISLFMVYLEKPVIKRVKKTEDGRFFDQNGNELRMKMGKLVAANASQSVPDIADMSDIGKRNPRNTPGRVNRQPQKAADQRRTRQPADRYTASAELPDNDELYAKAAAKVGREFTTEMDRMQPEAKPAVRQRTKSPERIAPERPVAEQAQVRRPAPEKTAQEIAVGKVAEARNLGQTQKSGFEDILAEYQNALNDSEKKKSQSENKKEAPKGTGFRQL